jgi:hypothetical protein
MLQPTDGDPGFRHVDERKKHIVSAFAGASRRSSCWLA